jgi:tetratricopeptide (TPR) repeat protein
MKQYLLPFAALLLLQTAAVFAGGKKEPLGPLLPPPVSNLVSLEDALAGAVALVEERTRDGDKIALAKIASPLSSLSDFFGSELDSRFSANGKLTVLARGQTLDQVNAEHELQMSGLVDDQSAVGIGHYLGAQVVITGDFTRFANFSQLSIRAVEVETARVLAVYSAKIDNGDPVLADATAPLGPAQGQPVSEKALEHLNLGKDYYAAGIPDIAIEELTKALAISPELDEAYLYRGRANFFRSENWQEMTISDYTAALRINPNNTEALRSRALVYFLSEFLSELAGDHLKGGYDRAIADYTAVLRINPDDTQALRGRASTYASKKDYDRAIADYTAALRINPNDASALGSRGVVYAKSGDYDRALADVIAALQMDPADGAYDRLASYYYRESKDYDRAFAVYTAVLRIAPTNDSVYNNRGYAYAEKGDYDKAIADFTQAIRLNPNNASVYRRRGFAYSKKGDYDRAIADSTQAIQLDPNYASAYFQRGVVYSEKGDYDRAIADYEATLRISPNYSYAQENNANAYFQRGYAYGEKKDYDRAIADYTQAIRLDSNNASAYNNRGYAYYNKKDYGRAIADYEAALRIDPNHPLARNNLENARNAQGRSNSTYTASPSASPSTGVGYGIGYVRAFDSENSGMFENSGITLSTETVGLSLDSLFSVDYLLGPIRQRYWVEESDNHVSYRQGDIVEHSLVLGLALGFPIAHIFTIYAGGGLGFTWNPLGYNSSGSSSSDPAIHNDTPPESSIELAWKVNAGLRLQYAGLFVKFDVSYGTILGPSYGIGIGGFN